MSGDTQFIRKVVAAPSSAGTLPGDLTEMVFRRIIILCLLTVAMAAFGTVICVGDLLMNGILFNAAGYTRFEVVKDALMVMVALGVAGLVHRRAFAPRVLIGLGLGFCVFTSLWHSVGEVFGLVHEPFPAVAFFSFNQAWVVFFPAIVPVRSRAARLTILLAAAIPVLVRAAAQWLGLAELPADSLVILSILMTFSAIMGLAVSHVVYSLGRSVTAARALGSYTLEEHLGGGGMGEVWRASHRLLARPAAVKLIKPEVLGGMQPSEVDLLNRRFEQEVQATAALCSPHTVEIYDYGLAQDGSFYYVMELLDGIDLETLVRRFGPVEPARAAQLLIQACHSLHEAHRRRLIHRDVKPANLFVCRYGEDDDFVKVLDFGLVKQQRRAGAETDANLTVEGGLAGTPAYLYPEAIAGRGPVDARSDLYSLGCVAFWLLTGRRVFEADSPMAVLVQHASESPPAPSRHSELAISPDFDALVLACLAKDPAARPRSADALARSLRDLRFERPWTPERARDWWDLHRA